ncbi:TnsA endonuclease N-terminal domain-containing protein [Clostridium sp.]|uniref:TnsA endonuclease N-terminal domain-containing protein n=1 Tax=Clostridium sp. TaxID=1506 RepID=UPI00290714D9|nr:TnsA endonuclease N-terminal domain-containing protein [Clostridium sp.]MDU5107630.1 TnsA endonuclease N-terminal domain-containing protein [Clostridium sp.]
MDDYKTAIKVNDFSSKGTATRMYSKKTGRIHHLLTVLEKNLFVLLDFDENIIGIKEHYELEDVRDVVDEADINWSYYKDYKISTSFLIIMKDGRKKAISCKNSSELYKRNVQLFLEIQRRYYANNGIDWCIITNKDLPKERLKNIKWLNIGESTNCNKDIGVVLKNTLNNYNGTLKQYLNYIANNYEYSIEEVLTSFKEMIITRKIEVNLDAEITLNTSLIKFRVKE